MLFGFLFLTPRLCSCDLVDVLSGESSADAAALELGEAVDLDDIDDACGGAAEPKAADRPACDDWSLPFSSPASARVDFRALTRSFFGVFVGDLLAPFAAWETR